MLTSCPKGLRVRTPCLPLTKGVEMYVTKEILKHLEGLPVDEAFEKLKEINNLHQERLKLDLAIEKEHKRHRQEMDDLKAKIKALANQCSHCDTTYHPDPSGNCDSSYECNICRTEVSRPKQWI